MTLSTSSRVLPLEEERAGGFEGGILGMSRNIITHNGKTRLKYPIADRPE